MLVSSEYNISQMDENINKVRFVLIKKEGISIQNFYFGTPSKKYKFKLNIRAVLR